MAVKHAVLSASSSERWLNCPPSARLCEAYEDKGSDYAAEGTDAHALCEFRLKQALGIPADDPIENLSWYNEEMEDCAAGYAAYVAELLETAKQTCADPVILIEQQVDFSRWVQDGFGTADCIVIADGELNIVDYKHGKGVEVGAVDNPQMMLYALGALEIFDGIYDIDSVRMTIYQPRKSNNSVCVMEKDGLLEWAQNDLVYKAKLAYEGGGDFHCGEWCRFCKAKAECRGRAEANLALARYDFEAPPLLTDEEIADILDKVEASALYGCGHSGFAGVFAVGAALDQLPAGEHRAADCLLERIFLHVRSPSGEGIAPYEKKLLGITAMQKLLGKSRFEELLSPYIEKPQGRPMLVRLSDKRLEWNTAKNDFMEEM